MVEIEVRDADEVFDGWLGTEARVIVAEDVEIEGHRFSPLERVRHSRRRLVRPKEAAHRHLRAHLGGTRRPHAARQPTANGHVPPSD
jgi:hypothetical protein